MDDMAQITDELAVRVAEKLTELQGQRSDAEMARLLGCTRPHWWNVKKGRRRPSYELIRRAVKPFPDLYQIVMTDLASEPEKAAS